MFTNAEPARRYTSPREILDRHPPEFARLVGVNSLYPLDGLDRKALAENNRYMIAAGYNPWA